MVVEIYNINRWNIGVTVQAATGDFTWDNFKKFGTGINLGGPVAYSYSEGGIYRNGNKSKFSLHGLSFGIGAPRFKRFQKINASSSVTYTIPFIK